MPRFYFDIDDGETIRGEEGHELVDLDAARGHVRRALSEMLAYELLQGNAPRICVHVRNEAGERVMTASGRGEMLIGEASEGAGGKCGDEADGGTLSPLNRAAQYAIAARKAIDEDGCASLRHWADILVGAIGNVILLRLNEASRPKPK